VAPPDHPVAQQEVVLKSDLAGVGVLSMDRRHHTHRQLRDICNDLAADLLEDYEGTSLDSLRQMCGSGLGFAILPELYLRSEVGGEDMVKRLDIKDWSATRSIAAAWRDGAAYTESYRLIADLVAAEARSILDQPST
jgi:LysR family hydrogen peroxide-inducible transcriptional activator